MAIDAILRLSSVLGLALVLAVRAAHAEVRDGQLGAACASTSECAAGLTCWAPDALNLEVSAPAGGVCGVTCGPTHQPYDYYYCYVPNSFCDESIGFCLESCALNTSFGDEFDPEKCHGRPDMACGAGRLCLPRCSADEQCPSGFACDWGTGLCRSSVREGDPFGSACDPAADPSTCRGVCRHYADEVPISSGEGGAEANAPRALGVCEEACVIGVSRSCALPDGSGEGACLLPSPGSGRGDQGQCVRLCNCSSDCPDVMVCEPWDFGGRYDAVGACVLGARAPGARNCPIPASGGAGAEPECVSGERRACMTGDGCLGVAVCRPDETYAACECADPGTGAGGAAGDSGDSPSGGAAGADALGGTAGAPDIGGAGGDPDVPRGPPGSLPESGWACDCRVTRAPYRTDSMIWVCCVLIVAVGRARMGRGRWRA